jgi:hypothetical protein
MSTTDDLEWEGTMKDREDARVFALDGEPVDLDELLDANREGLDDEEIDAIRAMKPGDSISFGGGAWATFVVACSALATRARFSFDGGPAFEGYDTRERWNGWAIPLLPEAEVERLRAWLREQDHDLDEVSFIETETADGPLPLARIDQGLTLRAWADEEGDEPC